MKKKVVTLGEIMMRLSPVQNKRFIQSNNFEINFGGAEANVAVLLSHLGLESTFVTKLPSNQIGEMVLGYLRSNGVDINNIAIGGDRVGVYYFEKGVSTRNAQVVYDRKGSSMSEAIIEDFNLEEIFKNASLFHVSGITPALGEDGIKIVKECIEYCKNNNIRVSVDLNYRSKLWSYKKFNKVMKEIVKGVDICIGWIDLDSSADEFTPVKFNNLEDEKLYFNKVFRLMKEELGVKHVATTLRETISASENTLRGLIYNGEEIIYSRKYSFEIIDRVGAGDAFAGGLLYKLLEEESYEEIIEFAVASGVYKHTIQGDASIATKEEIETVIKGMLAGGVAR
ncbi:sugar kinase [Clostridium gasigenes]|uniref:Sugar kinase n=1 Tax=Clostridium gasigenes TaxID=94869 RepID=A0A7X0SDX8_9CLOT|nr:sugar kinase [Clostridium gasigenes]MBB6714502.1 sugar kinase [Clostridium gasigenes]